MPRSANLSGNSAPAIVDAVMLLTLRLEVNDLSPLVRSGQFPS
jgi:hypothetical protein